MKWNRYDIKTTTDACDLIISELMDLGITSVEIKDNILQSREILGGNYIDIPPDLPDDDGTAVISFYLDNDNKDDNKRVIADLKLNIDHLKNICNIGEGTVSVSETEDQDWIDNWKQYWHKFSINDLLIIPTWEKCEDETEKKHIIRLDPGTSFGTGAHETTRLVIDILQKIVKDNDKVIDLGCGSGILSIVSILYGAKHTLGIDLDKNAVTASRDNAAANGILNDQADFIFGDILADENFKKSLSSAPADIICANILPDVLIPLAPEVTTYIKSGGHIIFSGILNSKQEKVTKALYDNPEITEIEIYHDGEWCAIKARKK